VRSTPLDFFTENATHFAFWLASAFSSSSRPLARNTKYGVTCTLFFFGFVVGSLSHPGLSGWPCGGASGAGGIMAGGACGPEKQKQRHDQCGLVLVKSPLLDFLPPFAS
jgi:hypothetical protein